MLGIAKLIRQQRPDDFHVLVASATIDPKPFLEFFEVDPALRGALDVPGRIFPVTIANEPADEKIRFQPRLVADHVIPCVVATLNDPAYAQGHALVFLPGQGEIEAAIKAFRLHADSPANCYPLSLFGGMPTGAPAKANVHFAFFVFDRRGCHRDSALSL